MTDHKMPIEIKLTIELLSGLLQGKEVHYNWYGEDEKITEVRIYPPQGNIVMTREEYKNLRRKVSFQSNMELLQLLEKLDQSNIIKAELIAEDQSRK